MRAIGARTASLLALFALAGGLLNASPALAQNEHTPGSVSGVVTVPSTLPTAPSDFSLDASDAINVANETDTIQAIRDEYTEVKAAPQVANGQRWEVFYEADGDRVALIVVGAVTGEVLESWTGDQVAWQMARGNEGQFGHILNAPYVWLPLSAVFLLGLLDFRRPRRLAHLDLLVLLSFGVSHIFFNAAEIGVSVPLAYPPLIYLLARCLWIGFRGEGGGLRPSVPAVWLAVALTFLIGFRIAINVSDSGVIDVGYAGVIGADHITHGDAIYGEHSFPTENPTGDTYGPANYLAYVPFELAFPWSGSWDDLPAAHAAAIFFDLATIAGLFVLGARVRRGRQGRELGVILAFAWVAFPYTAFALQSNSNDTLIAALLVWSMVVFSSVARRAVLLALATMVKFVPLVLVPLYAAGERGLLARGPDQKHEPTLPRPACFATVFASIVALMLVYPAIDPGLSVAYDRTIGSQLGRESPFSIWGQAPSLAPVQSLLIIAVAALGALLAFRPVRRNLTQVCALSAAMVIAVELTLDHWFYLYIPWFLGPAMAAIAVCGAEPQPVAPEQRAARVPTEPPAARYR